ncbi:MAG: hypothetical protein ABR902_15660 [Candidatus Korobacteraceae bacterium]
MRSELSPVEDDARVHKKDANQQHAATESNSAPMRFGASECGNFLNSPLVNAVEKGYSCKSNNGPNDDLSSELEWSCVVTLLVAVEAYPAS